MGRIRKLWKSMATGGWFAELAKGKWPDLDDPPPPEKLSEDERRMLMKWFHQDYNRYPVSEYEFQQWLHDNW